MDLQAHRRRVQKTISSDNLCDLYPHDVTMYLQPPSNEISLNEFEDVAFERLQLLRLLEQASLKGHTPHSEDWHKCIKEDLSKAGLKKYLRLIGGFCGNTELDFQARRADHISHFILRLAYCRSEDLRRWFLNREMEWFRVKFQAQTSESIKRFLEINNLTYPPTSEKDSLREELMSSTLGLSSYLFETSEFYKVPFTDVLSLVKNRRVYLSRGVAYIPSTDLVVVIQSKFRASLSESLNFYYRRLPLLDDDRLDPLLSNLHTLHTGSNYYSVKEGGEAIDPKNLDQYSKRHFPLCMRHMHEVLKATHHLKHGCRLQYGLFLKAIGLTYEEAVKFFREEYSRAMDVGKFEKQYLYNIRHQYGKVGRMLNYSPYSCVKIVNSSVGAGEHHGCPFKHWDAAVLRQKLVEYGVGAESANEIKELAAGGHFQIACGKYFECTRGKAANNAINHPNQYFEESMNLDKETEKK